MDDQEMVRAVALRMLTKMGFSAVGAGSGQEAVSLFAAALRGHHPFDVVILDLTVIGGMGGKEALSRILSLDPSARVIVSSGYSNDPVLADHRRHGALGVLPKPYRLQELKKAMSELVEA